jgi:hypothetical protein
MTKRVATITFYHETYNYGAILQAYALQTVLQNLGFNTEILNYQRSYIDITNARTTKLNKLVKKFTSINSLGDIDNLIRYPFRKVWLEEISKNIDLRKSKIEDFKSDYTKKTNILNSLTILNLSYNYDAFICGSDQIWNPTRFDPNFFLSFVPENRKKIAYAASLGVNAFSASEKAVIAPLLNRFDAISVREESAVKLISELTDKNVVKVLDPTLLLDRNYWLRFVHNLDEKVKPKQFIFSYQIGQNNAHRDLTKRLGRKLGLPIVSIPGVAYPQPYDFSYSDINFTDASPQDFISLIAQSELLVTDSFHACVFAILFGKKFVALQRDSHDERLSMNSRIYDLLKMFLLEDHLLRDPKQAKYISAKDPKPEKEAWRQLDAFSKDYLMVSLSTE